jgi:hypothetical protein
MNGTMNGTTKCHGEISSAAAVSGFIDIGRAVPGHSTPVDLPAWRVFHSMNTQGVLQA